jgi:hypothetical protein
MRRCCATVSKACGLRRTESPPPGWPPQVIPRLDLDARNTTKLDVRRAEAAMELLGSGGTATVACGVPIRARTAAGLPRLEGLRTGGSGTLALFQGRQLYLANWVPAYAPGELPQPRQHCTTPVGARPLYSWQVKECGFGGRNCPLHSVPSALSGVWVHLAAMGSTAEECWVTLDSVMRGLKVVAPEVLLWY